jgi:hypothetical protein
MNGLRMRYTMGNMGLKVTNLCETIINSYEKKDANSVIKP